MSASFVAAAIVYFVILAALGVHAVRAVIEALRVRRLRVTPKRRAAGEPCLVCGACELREIAPYVVRCDSCGFLGGAVVTTRVSPELRPSLTPELRPAAPRAAPSAEGRPSPFAI